MSIVLFLFIILQSCGDPVIPEWKNKVNISLLDSLHSLGIRQHVRSYRQGITEQLRPQYNYEEQPSCKEFDGIVQHLEIINCGITRDSTLSVWCIHINKDPNATEGVIICRNCDTIASIGELNIRLGEKDPLLLDTLIHYSPINSRYYWFSTFHSRGNILEILYK